jgi:hypothetical protein
MVEQKKLATTLALLSMAVLLISGCATPTDTPAAPTPTAEVVPDCGTFAILEWEGGGGTPTRREVLEDMVRGTRSIIETPDDELNRSTPEDTLMTLEAALTALPRIEEQADVDETVTVPAMDDTGTYLGEFVIERRRGNYVIDTYTIAHEGGIPCPTTE